MEVERGSHKYSLKDYLLKYVLSMWKIAQSAGAVEYTNCTSAEGKNPPLSVFDMALNNLMMKFQ